jgi:hypothetical protein
MPASPVLALGGTEMRSGTPLSRTCTASRIVRSSTLAFSAIFTMDVGSSGIVRLISSPGFAPVRDRIYRPGLGMVLLLGSTMRDPRLLRQIENVVGVRLAV